MKTIYVFTSKTFRERRLFKIGETTRDVGLRISEWQGGCPEDLELELTYNVPMSVTDKQVHKLLLEQFGANRARGGFEWFRTTLKDIHAAVMQASKDNATQYTRHKRNVHLRPYQVEIDMAVDCFLDGAKQRGQIYSPTGSGKTESFINTIKKQLNGARRICIAHPRLNLSREQLQRFKDAFGTTPPFIVSFNSGSNTGAHLETTNQQEVENLFKSEKDDILVFSSYQSLHRLVDLKFDLMVFDEAHNAVSETRVDILENLNADKILFYTATPIIDSNFNRLSTIDIDDDFEFCKGMNNPNHFGHIIYEVPPKRLIAEGYIVKPDIHTVEFELKINPETGKKEIANPCHVAALAFNAQYQELVLQDKMPYAQMLVAFSSVDNIEYFNMHLNEFEAKLLPELKGKVATFTTESRNGTFRNGVPFTTPFAQTVQEHKGNAVICHYNQIGEGIDISSITGFMSMRNLRPAGYIQMLGRSGRPFVQDYIEGGNGKLKYPIETRLKKHCLATIPTVEGVPTVISDGRPVPLDVATLINSFVNGGYDDLFTYMKFSPAGQIGGEDGNGRDYFYSEVKKALIARKVVNMEQAYFTSEARVAFDEMLPEDQNVFLLELQSHVKENPEIVNILLEKHRENRGKTKNLKETHFVEDQPYLPEETVREMLGKIKVDGEKDYLIYYCLEQAEGLIHELLARGAKPSRIDLKTTTYCETTEKWCALLGINYIFEEDAE